MNLVKLKKEIFNLYKKAATELPEDLVKILKKASIEENQKGSKDILIKILANISLAKKEAKPICQDTGIPIFYIEYPKSFDLSIGDLKKLIQEVTNKATKEIPLRPNAIDILTEKNTGNQPVFHFEEGKKLKIDLLLKGGGSENFSAIYSLPNTEIKAVRDFNGVKKCVLDTIFKAQGKGCPPYIIGIAIGGSIEEVAYLSKKQLLRKIDDKNSIAKLNILEKDILKKINQLHIGPLGLGGKTTALGVKIAVTPRHPASYFVGISLGCWCLRRASL